MWDTQLKAELSADSHEQPEIESAYTQDKKAHVNPCEADNTNAVAGLEGGWTGWQTSATTDMSTLWNDRCEHSVDVEANEQRCPHVTP